MAKAPKNAIQVWGDKIGWARRVKAVCKPCWEIKYCPYGPLVEEFPLKEHPDERGCRIFGHDCPVFYVAEPFTETKELRRITRHIARPVQLRVLKRDNQICALCGQPVLDEDIHFDHMIPWSKVGSSEEHNIRLLCGDCNRKRGSDFEREYLIESLNEHIVEPIDVGFVAWFLEIVQEAHGWKAKHGKLPDGKAITEILGAPDTTAAEHILADAISNLQEFFASGKPREITHRLFRALRCARPSNGI